MSSLTAFSDMVPVPRVEVVVEPGDLLGSTDTFTLQSTSAGRTFLVRGGVLVDASTTAVVFDYEAAFNVATTYEALCFDLAGVYLGAVQLGDVTLLCDHAVIQQPLDPKRNAVPVVLAGTAEAIVHRQTGEYVWPDGAEFPVRVGNGPRGGIVGLPYIVLTESLDMAARLERTLGGYGDKQLQVWLVRSADQALLPRKLFCGVDGFTKVDYDVALGSDGITFSATLTEISPPVPALSPAVLRYSDVGAIFATYSAVGAVYTLYSDIARDQSLVGAAG